MYYRNRNNGLRAISGVIFLVFLGLAFVSHGLFLPLLFAGIGFAALFAAFSSGNRNAAFGGIMGAVWMFGLGFLFWTGAFWPGIIFLIALSAFLGAMRGPIMQQLGGMGMMQPTQQYQSPPPMYQPPQQQAGQQPPYQSYQQGYQPPQETYEEGGKSYPIPQDPEQPTTQYPQPQSPQRPQEMPPMQ